jgi:hypothetical protein
MVDYFCWNWLPTWWSDKALMEMRYSLYHYKALMLDGSVKTFLKDKDLYNWLWINQPADPRQYIDGSYLNSTNQASGGATFSFPSYVPG